ncbi:hypothetical protein BASA81_008907 [Batrachochytrium salamandrivorans]|nr:hypothetical protein BASA81_008907 [Batrachochytrium salamandrivorans]
MLLRRAGVMAALVLAAGSSVRSLHSSASSAPSYRHSQLHWNGRDRIIIVGDVHGCAVELELLLKRVGFSLETGDKLVFAGDLVRKGPESNQVVTMARECKATGVRGNHDEYALRDPENKLGLSRENLSFLEQLPLTLEIPELNVLVVHAGVLPTVAVENTLPMDLMTMRKLNDQLVPSKTGTKPWIDLWQGPQHVVFGHDAARGLQQTKFATGLDTGCVYGKRLTALVLPEFELISIPSTMPDKFAVAKL